MFVKKLKVLIIQWLNNLASSINQKNVLKEIYVEVEVSSSYFFILTLANLIALLGLITNNIAVIIGAMLISPLMGPILSSGFAFITEDPLLGKKALKKMALSVMLVIIVASVVTYLSPLKDITNEIITRTRPNLYDLAIAIFAGTAGSIALCTRKNYITIVPGVAIATAVIPPLSVTGFGLGSGNLSIAFGGFFLFFTNFVAIILASCVVFFLYGFRPGMGADIDISQIKKRAAVLAIILFVISLPLIYTLHTSISQVRLRTTIQTILGQELDKDIHSHLDSFTFMKGKNGVVEINAIINTVKYLTDDEIKRFERILTIALKRNVKLYVEQVRIQAGGFKEALITPLPGITPLQLPAQPTRISIGAFTEMAKKAIEKIEKIISPSIVEDFYLGFHHKTSTISITLKIRRDGNLPDVAVRWLNKILDEELNMKVKLTVETVPFIPPLLFNRGETDISDEMKGLLLMVKRVYEKDKDIIIKIESFADTQKEKALARKRIDAISSIITKDYLLPLDHIQTNIRTGKPMVRLSIVR